MTYTDEEAAYFAEYPVKSFDSFGTKDFDAFDYAYREWKEWASATIARLITDYDQLGRIDSSGDLSIRKQISEVYGMHHQIKCKLDGYGRATGNWLRNKHRRGPRRID